MKSIILFLLLIPYIAASQCNPSGNGLLSADVSGDTLILRNDTVTRNCAACYSMGISRLSSDTLIWMQTDIGDVAYCHCNFDLSVTLDSLSPGDYVVKAYYTQASDDDTCYIGSVPFTITQPESYAAPKVINQWQSACFTVGLEESTSAFERCIDIYPNPAGDILYIRNEQDDTGTVVISNLNGQLQISTIIKNQLTEIDLANLSPGIYFVKVIGERHLKSYKLIKE
ncbi:MAG: T9SS type A sorting domain-containing protein [Bacteroidales bacterium]|nr:T9SS type A sorting domain-containing protein [Bacteroidales bacterium]